ncbi:MAG TPA: DUF6572 domain-containing protein [Jatrophihabitans sp.]|nr:DUF6572 domain-containing protein [Jatrophihabitans sp.]
MGIRTLNSIDLIADGGEGALLVVLDDHAWESEEHEAAYLAKKVETCLNAIDSGQLAGLYPNLIAPGKNRIIVRISYARPIAEWIRLRLSEVFSNQEVAALGVSLEFTLME